MNLKNYNVLSIINDKCRYNILEWRWNIFRIFFWIEKMKQTIGGNVVLLFSSFWKKWTFEDENEINHCGCLS